MSPSSIIERLNLLKSSNSASTSFTLTAFWNENQMEIYLAQKLKYLID